MFSSKFHTLTSEGSSFLHDMNFKEDADVDVGASDQGHVRVRE